MHLSDGAPGRREERRDDLQQHDDLDLEIRQQLDPGRLVPRLGRVEHNFRVGARVANDAVDPFRVSERAAPQNEVFIVQLDAALRGDVDEA